MELLYTKILEGIKKTSACVVATIVGVKGSSPRHVGTKMAIFNDGSVEGTIGGGALETLVVRDAQEAFRRPDPFSKKYSLHKESGLQVCGGEVVIFFEVIGRARKLVIAGAGHIGLSLSFMAKLLRYSVTILDNRRDFANARRFPHADKIFCRPYPGALDKMQIDADTAIVLVTHGHRHDLECLRQALKTQAGYIGMIASRKKIEHVFGILKAEGVERKILSRVHSPIGLAIGAETPEEIAVSIAAEIIKEQKSQKTHSLQVKH